MVRKLNPLADLNEPPSKVLGKNLRLAKAFLEFMDFDEGMIRLILDCGRKIWSIWKKFTVHSPLANKLYVANFNVKDSVEKSWLEYLETGSTFNSLLNLCFIAKNLILNPKNASNFASTFLPKQGMTFLAAKYSTICSEYKLSWLYLKLLKYIQEAITGFFKS